MAAAARTLTQRDLNRALLARQLLLERARTALPRALERVGGLQAQYAPSMYIGLWSRLDGFERDDLTRALERRTVVQGTLMRSTIHLASARDFWPFALAIRRGRRDWWLRTHRAAPSAREMTALAGRLRRRLADGPLRRARIAPQLRKGGAGTNGGGPLGEAVSVPPPGARGRRPRAPPGPAQGWLVPAGVR